MKKKYQEYIINNFFKNFKNWIIIIFFMQNNGVSQIQFKKCKSNIKLGQLITNNEKLSL